MQILDEIVAHKRKEIEQNKEIYPVKLLERSLFFESPVISLRHTLKRPDKVGVIAEFKKRSPSRPNINLHADIEKISIGYMMGGASALSILTDKHFFGGSDVDLTTARKFNYCPILRKDFIIDEYQVIEARSIGADAILLIAEILSPEQISGLAAFAKSFDLEVLMEIHSEDQLSKLNEHIDVLGINNRNLEDFSVDPNTSIEIFSQLPESIVKISESGIHEMDTLVTLKKCGYDGFLIGERFMNRPDPVEACDRFICEFKKALSGQSFAQEPAESESE